MRGGAEAERRRMLAELEGLRLESFSLGPPALLWPHTSSGRFTISSFFKLLNRFP
ncbi:hypothetical protein LINPERHAP1_LOCUS25012, partial [Linum perenne]